MIIFLQTRKVRLREGKLLAQGHTAAQGIQTEVQTLTGQTAGLGLLTTLLCSWPLEVKTVLFSIVVTGHVSISI